MGTKGSWQNPIWWNDEHTSSWDRVKEAMKRDWEQTKADFGAGGRDIDQDVGDTVRQATGKEAIPPQSQPSLGWDVAEQPFAYGYEARRHYGSQFDRWDDRVETQLRQDWEASRGDSIGDTWERVKMAVKRGYERAMS